MTTTLILPWQRPPITSNEAARSNGRAHASTRKQMRNTARLLALHNTIGVHPRSDVMCTWYVPDLIHRDAGSLSALLKASIDGLVDAGVWPDDWFAYVRTESCRVDLDRQNPRIELTITPVDTGHNWTDIATFENPYLELCLDCGKERTNEEQKRQQQQHEAAQEAL